MLEAGIRKGLEAQPLGVGCRIFAESRYPSSEPQMEGEQPAIASERESARGDGAVQR